MKELSLEEKAKAYDEAIKRAKAMIPVAANQEEIYNSVITIFPELKESEDERIKDAINYAICQSTHKDGTLINGVTRESALTWLEKQGEQKLVLDKESSFVDNDVRLSLELYRDGNGFGIWLSDDFGGSGIDATGNTPEEAANSIAAYIADYFYKRDDII